MKFWFLLLLIVNVFVGTGIYLAEHRPGAEAQAALLQINPGKVKLLKPGTPQGTASATPAVPAKPVPVCLEWGSVAAEDIARAETAVAAFQLGDRLSRRETGDALYWVYFRALKSKAEADKKAVEVRARGVSDLSVIQDDNEWLVSLGAFKTEDAANSYLAQLKTKGVRSAIVGLRGARSVVFVVSAPDDALTAKFSALKSDFPAVALKATTCADKDRSTPAAAAKNG